MSEVISCRKWIPDRYARSRAHTLDMQTSIRVTSENRDALARIAATELRGVSLDETLRVVLFEHQSRAVLARLATDPGAAD